MIIFIHELCKPVFGTHRVLHSILRHRTLVLQFLVINASWSVFLFCNCLFTSATSSLRFFSILYLIKFMKFDLAIVDFVVGEASLHVFCHTWTLNSHYVKQRVYE